MIFASVGSMLPFDRLVEAVDRWAGDNPAVPVFIQIGRGDYLPRHAEYMRLLPHQAYRGRLEACRLFVAHVGMGSILQGLEARKQMLLMPRRHALGEHTTDHQLHTAARFGGHDGIHIVDTAAQFARAATALLAAPRPPGEAIAPHAQPALISAVAGFLSEERRA